jgi:sec-independent protein translocase protein TatC
MRLKQKQRNQPKRRLQPLNPAEVSVPFVEHLYELRRRLIYIVASILFFSTVAYFVQQQIVNFLLRPSRGQQFIYTSPGGGINFLFTVCTYAGIAASTPVIIYQVLGFFAPLIRNQTRRSLIRYSYFSGGLGIIGFCFGYYVGLPAALHFLGNQFTTRQVHPLFTIQEYMSFLTIYLLGSVLLFQLPIILLFINRIKPLPPRKLLKAERYVIVAAFIIAMIMAPTPNVLDQLIIAGPVIVMFNVSVGLIWAINRRPTHIAQLLEQDQQLQASRLRQPTVQLVASSMGSGLADETVGKTRRTIEVKLVGA